MPTEERKRVALVLDPSDNVGTLLYDAATGERVELKGVPGSVTARDDIRFGHKISLRVIPSGEPIVKYGQKIGYALSDITPGQWVHLHTMASELDADFRRRITE